MKKTIIIFALFWILTFPFYKALLSPQMITSDDLSSHIIRLLETDKAINDGHFPVRIFQRTNFGLGYPFIIFNYPLVYYTADIFYKAGLTAPDAFKFLMILSFPLSGFFAFLWLRNRFNNFSAILGGMVYTIIPYHFIDVYIRGAIGEIMALTVVPLGFYFIDQLLKKPNRIHAAFLSLSFAAIILLHNVTSLYFIPIFCLYFFIQFLNQKSKRVFLIFLGSLTWSLAISAFYLIPLFLYKPLVNLERMREGILSSTAFINFQSLIYMKWGFGGPNQNFGQGEMPLQLGLLQEFFLICSLILLILQIRKKKNINYFLALFWIVVFILASLLMLEISFPIWQSVPILQYQEFAWRLLFLIPVSSAFLASYFFFFIQNKLNKNLGIILGIFFIASLIYLNRNYARPESYYVWKNPFDNQIVLQGTETFRNEHLPLWHSKDEETVPYIQYRVISGNAEIKPIEWKTNLHTFNINVLSYSIVADKTDYFPGWKVYIDNQEIQILDPYSKEANGLIAFKLTPGNYKVEVKLEETNEEKTADLITIIALLLIPLIFIKRITSRR